MFYLLLAFVGWCAYCLLDCCAPITYYSKGHELIRLVRVSIEMAKRGRLLFGLINDEEIVEWVSHHCLGFILQFICEIKRLMAKNQPNTSGNELYFALSISRYNDRASIAWQRIISMYYWLNRKAMHDMHKIIKVKKITDHPNHSIVYHLNGKSHRWLFFCSMSFHQTHNAERMKYNNSITFDEIRHWKSL